MTTLEWTLAFTCTDRGDHDEELLFEQVFRGPVEALAPEALVPALPESSFAPGPCKVCGRDQWYRHADLIKLARFAVDQMSVEHRRVPIDISKLSR